MQIVRDGAQTPNHQAIVIINYPIPDQLQIKKDPSCVQPLQPSAALLLVARSTKSTLGNLPFVHRPPFTPNHPLRRSTLDAQCSTLNAQRSMVDSASQQNLQFSECKAISGRGDGIYYSRPSDPLPVLVQGGIFLGRRNRQGSWIHRRRFD
jgi:hypothetical protein